LNLIRRRILNAVSDGVEPRKGRQRTPVDPESRIDGRHVVSTLESKKVSKTERRRGSFPMPLLRKFESS
jgi:hypothetical protein